MITTKRVLVAEEQPQKTKTRKRWTGADALCKAANLGLKENITKIAEALTTSATGGNIQSVKFLLSLSEKRSQQETAKPKKARSLAAELKRELRWQGESSEEDSETAGGSREPEG